MALFLSTFVNKVDRKGRASVPATFRAALSQESFQGFVSFRSHKQNTIECCGYSRMERLSQSVDTLDLFSQEQDDFTATIFADSLQIPFDGDGRIILPKKLIEFIKIDDEIAFVGKGATFQLWKPQVFQEVQLEARDRMISSTRSLNLGKEN